MPRVKYEDRQFRSPDKRALVVPIQQIITQYSAQGYRLNPRGIAYRLEGQGIIRKTERTFQLVEDVVGEGRDMGLFDWDGVAIDAARNLHEYAMWKDPAARIKAAAANHTIDKWARQKNRVEVWTEKEGLLGVIGGACEDNDAPYRASTGYDGRGSKRAGALRILGRSALGRTVRRYQASSSDGTWGSVEIALILDYARSVFPENVAALEDLGQQLLRWYDEEKARELPEQHTVILYIGDHDPSGLDLQRDIDAKLRFYGAVDYEIVRVAITCAETCQDAEPELHSAPAKYTDSRYNGYCAAHGTTEAWEVEALEPSVLDARLRDAIEAYRDPDLWDEAMAEEERQRALLVELAERWYEWEPQLRGDEDA